MFGVARHLRKEPLRDVDHHFRFARAQDRADPVGVVQARRKLPPKRLEQLLLGRVDV